MRDEPAGLGVEDVAGWLRGRWGIEPVAVSYTPVGFGSYHWVVTDRHGPRWFVTAAARTTRELADRGYEFVLAGLPDRAGELVSRVRPDWALQVEITYEVPR